MTKPLDPVVGAKVRASFAAQSMLRTLGATLDKLEAGHVAISAVAGENVLQQQGYAHGGLIFTLGDSAAGYAALSVLPPDAEIMTVELKINFLAAAQGRLVAEGRVVKPGRRLIVVAADVWAVPPDGARIHAAALQGTMIPVGT